MEKEMLKVEYAGKQIAGLFDVAVEKEGRLPPQCRLGEFAESNRRAQKIARDDTRRIGT